MRIGFKLIHRFAIILATFSCLIAIFLGSVKGVANETRTFYEVDGLVSIEAENASYVNHWTEVDAVSGTAMKADEAGVGKGGGILRFDIEFSQPGKYSLWLLARKNPNLDKDSGNNIQIVFDRNSNQRLNPDDASPSAIHLGSMNILTWYSSPKDSEQPLYWTIEKPGVHHIELVTGSEWGFEVDKVVLLLNNENFIGGRGPIETSSPTTRQRSLKLDEDIILPPAWAFGVLYGKYANQDEVIKTVQRLIDEDYPIDAFWIDSWFWEWGGKGPKGYLDFKGDRNAFPDPASMWQTLANKNVKAGIWVWHQILQDGNEDVYEQFKSKEYFKRVFKNTNSWHNEGKKSMSGEVDFENPDASAFWKQKMKPLFDMGLDFLKLDASTWIPFCRTGFEATQELGRETKGRGFILSHKSGTSNPEFKRYPTKWSGDTKIAWTQPEWLEHKIVAQGGLKENIEMVANPRLHTYDIPFLTHDGGGFKEWDSKDLSDELYTRYLQFSSFNAIYEIFSSVTNETANMPFNFSPETQEIFRKYTHLRMRLFPYIYTYAHLTRQTGKKMIEGDINHPRQYLFGREFLVAPVYEKGARSREIYLPEGQWIDYWTGESYNGNQTISYTAPLDRLPLLVRAGAIIPMRDYARAIELGKNDPLTLDIYPHETSTFNLYEDDGISNDYLKGGFATTQFSVEKNNIELNVHINSMKGNYQGQPNFRNLILKVNNTQSTTEVKKDNANLIQHPSLQALEKASSGWYSDSIKGIVWVKFTIMTNKDVQVSIQHTD